MAVKVTENPTNESGPAVTHVYPDGTGWVVDTSDHLDVYVGGRRISTFARGLWRNVEHIDNPPVTE